MSAIIMPMDENVRKFCITSMAFIMVVGLISPSHRESAGPERDRMVARGTHDHTHNEPYEYEHIQPQVRISLSSTIALNNHYGELSRKIQEIVEWNRLLKILDEE